MSRKLKQIAIYGKGGIGKSTMASNISAALATSGLRVLQMGCDPKSDSTSTLRGGHYIPTVLDTLRKKTDVRLQDVVHEGFAGVYCLEAGGPTPGVGCAGRGIIAAVDLLKQLRVFEDLDLDVVLYDVLGDVVCGGFSVPIREGIAETVFTVSSSDFMSIYAANNLYKGIRKYSHSRGALFGGILANSINSPVARQIIDDFADRTKTRVLEHVPRSLTVTQAELSGRTTLEAAPDSAQAAIYRKVAEKVVSSGYQGSTPFPLDEVMLRDWAAGWAKQLLVDAQSRPASVAV
jgi:nitrogenase iron protein NifH